MEENMLKVREVIESWKLNTLYKVITKNKELMTRLKGIHVSI